MSRHEPAVVGAMRASPAEQGDAGRSLGEDAWRRLKQNRFAIAGACTVLLIALACFVLPWLLGMDAETTNPLRHHEPPGAGHWFGLDNLGRDYAARVLMGGRTSLLVGLTATLASVVVGVLYGATAGYFGGRVDEVMMRLVDFLYGIPYMFLVILVMLMFAESARGEALPVFIALGLVQWLTMARVVRGEVLSLRRREFVLAARLLGCSHLRIIVLHVVPNVMGVILVYATLTVPAVIILESFLSFLGLGVKLSWGQLVSEGVSVVNPIESHWWLLFWPSAFLALTLFSLNFLGDGLRDAFDPKTRQ
ncbi:MAG TPA: ABC transporter permease [Polyangiaceae bacterium]|nr:ABC transporter permease [Polyangiaceae bacterium]